VVITCTANAVKRPAKNACRVVEQNRKYEMKKSFFKEIVAPKIWEYSKDKIDRTGKVVEFRLNPRD